MHEEEVQRLQHALHIEHKKQEKEEQHQRSKQSDIDRINKELNPPPIEEPHPAVHHEDKKKHSPPKSA